MTIYKFSVITSNGFPYYHLNVNDPPEGVKLYLRFFDFSKIVLDQETNFNQANLFELHAGLISALFKFAHSMNKKIEILEFNSSQEIKTLVNKSKFSGNVLITVETEPYIFHRSVYEKINLIYNSIITSKIPLSSSMEILPTEEEKIINILTDIKARNHLRRHKSKINHVGTDFLIEMKNYGLNGICITSFDLSPITVIGKKYLLKDIHEILRNVGNIPEISPLNWVYRQSEYANEQIWVYIYKSNVGPSINGLFEPYLYLLFCDPHSYLGEIPEIVGREFNKILI
ncbi:MAG: hypothetical protein ACFE85_03065 [Candidatus Hodarchaeota archaeon]